jgi:glutaredoxin-like protein
MDKLLDEQISRQISDFFVDLVRPVEILFFGSEEEIRATFCEETEQLLHEIVGLSALLSLVVFDVDRHDKLARQFKVTDAPTFVITAREDDQIVDYGIRFKGVPAGHELSSLIHSIMIVSRRDSNLKAETREALKAIHTPVHLLVFVTPTCPYCPRAVVLAHQMAFESPMVEAEMVEATEFPELADQFNVSGVPQTTINLGAGIVVGAANERQLLEHIQQALDVPAQI